MTKGGSPWDDPAVDAGFRAAYEPDGLEAMAPPLGCPARLSPGRALAGAAVSVAGLALGIATLLWITDDPSQDPGPVVSAPVSASEEEAAPLLSTPQEESAPPAPPPAPVAPPVAEPAPVAPPVVVPVTVLNNSRITGLAARGAAQYEAAGWPVARTGNYRGRIRSTTVYYAAGLEASAREFASRFPSVQRVLPRPENLPGSGLTVVLTRDSA